MIRFSMFHAYFGEHLPMFQGQGELTLDEFVRQDGRFAHVQVMFHIDDPFDGYMMRWFDDKEALLDYMRKWGLGATDISWIIDTTPKYKEQWCVLAFDPFYGTAYGKEGYRRRWYFDTEAEADAFIDGGGIPEGMQLAEVYQVNRRIF